MGWGASTANEARCQHCKKALAVHYEAAVVPGLNQVLLIEILLLQQPPGL